MEKGRGGETAVSRECRGELVALLNGRLAAFHQGAVTPTDLLLVQRLNRAVTDQAAPSAAALADGLARGRRQPGLQRGYPGKPRIATMTIPP